MEQTLGSAQLEKSWVLVDLLKEFGGAQMNAFTRLQTIDSMRSISFWQPASFNAVSVFVIALTEISDGQ